AIPVGFAGGLRPNGVKGVLREQRRAAADVLDRVALERLGAQAKQLRSPVQRVQAWIARVEPRRAGDVVAPAVNSWRDIQMPQVHHTIAAPGAGRSTMVLPARQIVCDREQYAFRHAELVRGGREGPLE